jgi:DNA-binding transcriptional MerR regulator
MDKLYHSIREVASLLGEPEPTLRFWESEFPDLISPRRNDRGVRFYSGADIENVRLVYYLLREKKLTLDGARQQLKNNKAEVEKKAKLIKHLKNIRGQLKELGDCLDMVDKQKHFG